MTNYLKLLLLLSLAASAKTATAQYVQFSTNLSSLTLGIASATVDAPAGSRAAIQFTYGRLLFHNEESVWREDELEGYRLTGAIKYYFERDALPNEGFFAGAYLRYVHLDARHLDQDWLFGNDQLNVFRSQRTVLGATIGYDAVLPKGLTFSMAVGAGGGPSTTYSCPTVSGETCELSYSPARDFPLHIYSRAAIGYRIFSKDARLAREEAELERTLRELEALQTLRDEVETGDERPEGMSDVKWRRLQRKLEYRARRGQL